METRGRQQHCTTSSRAEMTDPKNPQQPRPPRPCEVGRVAEGERGRNLFRKNPENFYKIFYGLTHRLGCSGFRKHKGAVGAARVKGTQVLFQKNSERPVRFRSTFLPAFLHTFMPRVKKHDGPRLSPTHLSTQFQSMLSNRISWPAHHGMVASRPGFGDSYCLRTITPLTEMLSSTTSPPAASNTTAMLLTCWPGVIGGEACSGLLGLNWTRLQPTDGTG